MPASGAGSPRTGTPIAGGDAASSPAKTDSVATPANTASAAAPRASTPALGAGTPTVPGTPGATNSAGGAGVGDAAAASTSSESNEIAAICAFLRKKGYARLEQNFKAELEAEAKRAAAKAKATRPSLVPDEPSSLQSLQPISLKELAAKNAPRDLSVGGAEASTELPDGADALADDPTDTSHGFRMIKNWAEGSLEVYQPELKPLLLPLFVHSYLNLIEKGLGDAAAALYTAYASSFQPHHTALLSQIRAIALPHHLTSDPLAVRFRTERYIIKMTHTTFMLLLGWLTDGLGPVSGAGAAADSGLEQGEPPAQRRRSAMLKILNERCRIQVIQALPYDLDPAALQEGAGLTGVGPKYAPVGITLPSQQYSYMQADAVSENDVVADYNANAAGPQLKLHPSVPMNERLQADVEKELELNEWSEKQKEQERIKEEKKENGTVEEAAPAEGKQAAAGDVSMTDGTSTPAADGAANKDSTEGKENKGPAPLPDIAPASSAGLLQPTASDLLPGPSTYRNVDVSREVARIMDARKALRFDLALESGTSSGGGFLSGVRDASFNALGEEGAKVARAAAMPSVCAYTFHDADDGLTSSTFSQDSTMMAAGFEESYVQVWSLKGERLKGLRNNFDLSEIRDGKSLKKIREKEAYSTRKLIGHSGPVYGVDFDPTGGSASAPRHLLSSSADGTARLWSLDTFSALVSYRGHTLPVWNVKWAPQGFYFATASADKTARLWTTERVNPLRIYAGHLSDVDCLDFHPNSLYLATGSSDRTCRLWDVQRGTCLRLFVGHTSAVSCVKISPDGRYLASAGFGDGFWTLARNDGPAPAGEDTAISLWDLASGKRIKQMWGHTATVHSLDFSSDGNLLVSGGADCTVRCWDVKGAGGPRRSTGPGTVNAGQLSVAPEATNKSVTDLAIKAGASTKASNESPINWTRQSSADCVATFFTKQTPIIDVSFTSRNLCLVSGAFDPTI